MKIHFLTESLSALTGGCIYDGILYNKLRDRFGDAVKLFDYDYFENGYSFLKQDFLKYGMNFRKHAEELLDCDYLILNTTMYQKFLLFPWERRTESRCRIIGITHHLDFMSYTDRTREIRKDLLISLMRHCDCLISSSPYTINCLKLYGLSDRAMLIESYLDNTVHECMQKKEKLICFVGTVEPRKGVDLGIRAFAEFHRTHPDYRFQVAGSFMTGYSKEPYCRSLLRLVSELGLEESVIFSGRIEEEEKRELYERAKILLFPSQLEGYGWVMVEAMSYGLPVVCFDNSAMPYTVNDTNGVLVPNKDVHAMAEALNRLADDTVFYEHMSAGAARTAAGLPDRDVIDKEYEDFMDQLEARTI